MENACLLHAEPLRADKVRSIDVEKVKDSGRFRNVVELTTVDQIVGWRGHTNLSCFRRGSSFPPTSSSSSISPRPSLCFLHELLQLFRSASPTHCTMDIAYDHIQEETLSPEEAARKTVEDEKERQTNLNTELQETYKSLAASPWPARLGGCFSDVRKQGTSFYDEARQEASAAGGEAMRGFTGLRETLVGRARSMSGSANDDGPTPRASVSDDTKEKTDEAAQDGESVINRFRSEAAKRLKDLEKAEEAADAAIFKFGANIGNFLKDAVTVAPPTEEQSRTGAVLFESKDQDGKRVIHSTRFDAQLHAIHSNAESFLKDPASDEFDKWKTGFDLDKKT